MGSEKFSTLAKCNSLDAVTEEPEDFTVQVTSSENLAPSDKEPASEIQTSNGKPSFTKNEIKLSKYGLAGMLGGKATNGGVRRSEDKGGPPKKLRSYSKIAQIFEEYSVSKIKV